MVLGKKTPKQSSSRKQAYLAKPNIFKWIKEWKDKLFSIDLG
jgi:hypothetical protein